MEALTLPLALIHRGSGRGFPRFRLMRWITPVRPSAQTQKPLLRAHLKAPEVFLSLPHSLP